MDKAKQKRINRNNRKRGGAFEKRGADILDMDVVPYSGSNARFGYGDVRDSIWLGEFKNITPDGDKITIKISWIDKNDERAYAIDHIPFLAWMPAGKADKYIMIDIYTASRINVKPEYDVVIENKVHNTKNIIVHLGDKYFKDIRKGKIIKLISNDREYLIMDIKVFKQAILDSGMKGKRNTI